MERSGNPLKTIEKNILVLNRIQKMLLMPKEILRKDTLNQLFYFMKKMRISQKEKLKIFTQLQGFLRLGVRQLIMMLQLCHHTLIVMEL